ncbi:hypothetical protein BDF19DRAFT_411469 [Syncephalis fuscata]|nr:hypothetical protein BDF19DRAFT_411469 [Syncephalis fuscata]
MSVASSAMVAESHAAQAALLSEQHHRQQQQQQQQQHQHSQHDNGQLAGIHHIMHHTSSELHGMDPSVALQGEVADLHGDPAIIEYTQRRRNGRRGPAAVSPSPKPPVGSADWHRVRRENHKEVERRRREAINEGITALAKIVPGCERAKGSILARAAEYIEQLKETSTTNIEKWTLEKLLTDQAINDLTLQVNTLEKEKEQLEQRVAELEAMAASSSLSTRMAQVHDRRNDGALDDTEYIYRLTPHYQLKMM